MKLLRILAAVVLAATLAGCSLSEKQYEQYRIVFKQHPEARSKYTAICVKDAKTMPRREVEVLAELLDIRLSNFHVTACRRFFDAYVSGRLTYADYKAVMAKKPTARVIRILKGK
ncbi:MAG: hypothetical protein JWL86_3418 [Rhizobium sp.]|nr:hypothetical protein [Rhizobium sp.]